MPADLKQDKTLARYLKARKGHVPHAAKLLAATLRWRKSMHLGSYASRRTAAPWGMLPVHGDSGMLPAPAAPQERPAFPPTRPAADTLSVNEFSRELATGKMYVMGPDDEGHAILITRKRSDAFRPGENDHYLVRVSC